MYILYVATEVITDNAEIAVNSDIIIRCPNARSEDSITWQLKIIGDLAVSICTRSPTEIQCFTGAWQSPQYRNRVTRDNSAGSDVGAYSIRVSGVLINETGTYSCDGDSTDLDVFNNVRIISEFLLCLFQYK